jgi:ketosteroid isomerase-like protein
LVTLIAQNSLISVSLTYSQSKRKRSRLIIATLISGLGGQPAFAESALTSITAREQSIELANAKAALGRYLSACSGTGSDATEPAPMFTEDAVVELKLASHPEWTVVVQGSDAFGKYVADLSQFGAMWNFTDVYYFPTQQPDVVFVQYTASALSRTTGQPLRYRSMVMVELSGERIARVTDVNGAPLVIQARQISNHVASMQSQSAPHVK